MDDEIVIKEEPQTWDSPWAMDSADTWALDGLEDSEMAALETADLLRDFDDPFAGLGSTEYVDLCKPQHEIHAAKKNLAMMAAVMFSVSFFGNSPSFYNVIPGSNFSSMFGAQAAAKDLSQMSIASRIVACLEKTSWKEFRDVSTWLSAQTATNTDESDSSAPTPTPNVVASPSAASDMTDTDENLGVAMDDDTDLLDQFEYPVEDSVLASAASGDWLRDVAPTTEPESSASASLTSRLYAKLTTLWREKNQVLLTVRDDKQQVLQRSLADMSSIREGLESGNLLASVLGGKSGANKMDPTQDQSVTFLYPMSAFASDKSALPSIATTDASVLASNDADPVFLEVSCQLNGHGVAAAMM